MNRVLALLFAALALLLPGAAAHAQQGARVVERVSWVEEWDPASQQWVRVDESPANIAPAGYQTTSVARSGGVTITETIVEHPVRFIASTPRLPVPAAAAAASQGAGIGRFGPFRVIDGKRAALVASTDAASPQAFAAMLAAYPGLEVIEFADAPGTSHDLANLALGRAIRAAGLATHVPAGGSARSGAVELFLAGTIRTVDTGALFAVHSWRDERGREPADFSPDAPENRLYLDYYAEMGMTADEARGFYAMTNSVPHSGALWLQGEDMVRWIAPAARTPATRALDPQLDDALRLALARSGGALIEALRAPVTLRAGVSPVPQLVYADLGADLGTGLLDSTPAFP